MNIVFLCPPAGVINGGTKFIYQMATVLSSSGLDVKMFEQNAQRPSWFATDLPVIGQGVLHPDPDQVFVIPEDQNPLLEAIKDWPQRKVIYSQNQFYGALGVGNAESYADYGVTHILCSSQTIFAHARQRHPKLQAFVVPCSIDPALFKPLPKRNSIAFMPRKRPLEAAYIRDMFRHLYPSCQNWDWCEISGKSEEKTAQLMGESAVFLSLSRLEGFGLTPLEAMASGCIVAGFTGLGGWEYATDENGFWANEDDFPTCLACLKRATDLASLDETNAQKSPYHQATAHVLARYTPEIFKRAVLEAWTQILATPRA